MQCIHDIRVISDRISCRLVNTLRPCRRADDDHRVRVVRTDDRNDLLRIGLDVTPGRTAVRLIADLIENISLTGVLRRHPPEKVLCLILILQRCLVGQNMPVDDHVHSKIRRCLHACINRLLQLRPVTVGAVATALRRVHGQTDEIGAPAVAQRAESILIDKLREPCDTVRADALQLIRFSMGIHEVDSVHLKLTVIGKRRT